MPTQSDYESTARLLRNQAWSYRDTVAWSPRHPAERFCGPGVVADTIDERYHGVLRTVADAAAGLDRAAAECERRAVVCGVYRDELDRYWALPADVRSFQPFPQRPAAWVEI